MKKIETVIDFIPATTRIYPVGRLDYNSQYCQFTIIDK